MAFIRRKRGQVLLVHNAREPGSSSVRQRELHRFTSPADLQDVLGATEWAKWTRAVAWRERTIEFDWPAIRRRLEAELEEWVAEPSGATHRRDQKIERLVSELAQALAQLSPAKTVDTALLERVRPSLRALHDSVERLLTPHHHIMDNEEPHMFLPTDATISAADSTFHQGMEHWWAGDRRTALTSFRRALKHDPHHADAHNHLGIAKLEGRRLKDAERHFRFAVEGGQRQIQADGDRVPWAIVDNRPYLRALGNLACVLTQRRQWQEAVAIQERLLQINPDDDQGVRWLIGLSHLRAGDAPSAIAAFERTFTEEAGCAFGLALARLVVDGPAAEVGEPLLHGFAHNRYVAPMLLGSAWTRLDGFHGTNMAEPQWASDVVAAQADLWHRISRGAEVLRFWWCAGPVVAWRHELDEVMVELEELAASDERSALAARGSALRSEDAIAELLGTVAAAS